MIGISFEHPARLGLLALVVVLAVGYGILQAARQRYAVRFTNLDLLDTVAPRRPGWPRHLVAATFLAALGLQVTAFAGPQRVAEVPRERATVIIAVDVSLSMAADDIPPSRFHGAREAALSFLDQLPARFNVGLVAFAGIATTPVLPTQDHDEVRRALGELQLDEGTAIGDAILVSLRAIETVPPDEEGTPPPATIVLLSDGASTRGVDDAVAAREAAEAGVSISTISFGTSAGSIELPQFDGPIPVPVDQGAMDEIARITGGQSFDARTTGELLSIYEGIGSSVGFIEEPRSITPWFIGSALVAAVVAGLGSLIWSARLP